MGGKQKEREKGRGGRDVTFFNERGIVISNVKRCSNYASDYESTLLSFNCHKIFFMKVSHFKSLIRDMHAATLRVVCIRRRGTRDSGKEINARITSVRLRSHGSPRSINSSSFERFAQTWKWERWRSVCSTVRVLLNARPYPPSSTLPLPFLSVAHRCLALVETSDAVYLRISPSWPPLRT